MSRVTTFGSTSRSSRNLAAGRVFGSAPSGDRMSRTSSSHGLLAANDDRRKSSHAIRGTLTSRRRRPSGRRRNSAASAGRIPATRGGRRSASPVWRGRGRRGTREPPTPTGCGRRGRATLGGRTRRRTLGGRRPWRNRASWPRSVRRCVGGAARRPTPGSRGKGRGVRGAAGSAWRGSQSGGGTGGGPRCPDGVAIASGGKDERTFAGAGGFVKHIFDGAGGRRGEAVPPREFGGGANRRTGGTPFAASSLREAAGRPPPGETLPRPELRPPTRRGGGRSRTP